MKEWSEKTADESDILNLGEKKKLVLMDKGIRPQGKHTEGLGAGGEVGVRGGGGGEVENTCAVRCLQITTGKKCSHAFLTLEL